MSDALETFNELAQELEGYGSARPVTLAGRILALIDARIDAKLAALSAPETGDAIPEGLARRIKEQDRQKAFAIAAGNAPVPDLGKVKEARWRPISEHSGSGPVFVWNDDARGWLPFVAWRGLGRWNRPCTSDRLPYEPTHFKIIDTPAALATLESSDG